MDDETRIIPIAALHHYAFCPRQCALIHQFRIWNDNFHTAKGNILHERVDSGVRESKSHIITERNVQVSSLKYGLMGKLDVLEKNLKKDKIYPVEYKKGKPKIDKWDCIQLCAQVLCLEEMLDIEIEEAFLWYWQTRRRESVSVDYYLRKLTIETVKKFLIFLQALCFQSLFMKKNVIHVLCSICANQVNSTG